MANSNYYIIKVQMKSKQMHQLAVIMILMMASAYSTYTGQIIGADSKCHTYGSSLAFDKQSTAMYVSGKTWSPKVALGLTSNPNNQCFSQYTVPFLAKYDGLNGNFLMIKAFRYNANFGTSKYRVLSLARIRLLDYESCTTLSVCNIFPTTNPKLYASVDLQNMNKNGDLIKKGFILEINTSDLSITRAASISNYVPIKGEVFINWECVGALTCSVWKVKNTSNTGQFHIKYLKWDTSDIKEADCLNSGALTISAGHAKALVVVNNKVYTGGWITLTSWSPANVRSAIFSKHLQDLDQEEAYVMKTSGTTFPYFAVDSLSFATGSSFVYGTISEFKSNLEYKNGSTEKILLQYDPGYVETTGCSKVTLMGVKMQHSDRLLYVMIPLQFASHIGSYYYVWFERTTSTSYKIGQNKKSYILKVRLPATWSRKNGLGSCDKLTVDNGGVSFQLNENGSNTQTALISTQSYGRWCMVQTNGYICDYVDIDRHSHADADSIVMVHAYKVKVDTSGFQIGWLNLNIYNNYQSFSSNKWVIYLQSTSLIDDSFEKEDVSTDFRQKVFDFDTTLTQLARVEFTHPDCALTATATWDFGISTNARSSGKYFKLAGYGGNAAFGENYPWKNECTGTDCNQCSMVYTAYFSEDTTAVVQTTHSTPYYAELNTNGQVAIYYPKGSLKLFKIVIYQETMINFGTSVRHFNTMEQWIQIGGYVVLADCEANGFCKRSIDSPSCNYIKNMVYQDANNDCYQSMTNCGCDFATCKANTGAINMLPMTACPYQCGNQDILGQTGTIAAILEPFDNLPIDLDLTPYFVNNNNRLTITYGQAFFQETDLTFTKEVSKPEIQGIITYTTDPLKIKINKPTNNVSFVGIVHWQVESNTCTIDENTFSATEFNAEMTGSQKRVTFQLNLDIRNCSAQVLQAKSLVPLVLYQQKSKGVVTLYQDAQDLFSVSIANCPFAGLISVLDGNKAAISVLSTYYTKLVLASRITDKLELETSISSTLREVQYSFQLKAVEFGNKVAYQEINLTVGCFQEDNVTRHIQNPLPANVSLFDQSQSGYNYEFMMVYGKDTVLVQHNLADIVIWKAGFLDCAAKKIQLCSDAYCLSTLSAGATQLPTNPLEVDINNKIEPILQIDKMNSMIKDFYFVAYNSDLSIQSNVKWLLIVCGNETIVTDQNSPFVNIFDIQESGKSLTYNLSLAFTVNISAPALPSDCPVNTYQICEDIDCNTTLSDAQFTIFNHNLEIQKSALQNKEFFVRAFTIGKVFNTLPVSITICGSEILTLTQSFPVEYTFVLNDTLRPLSLNSSQYFQNSFPECQIKEYFLSETSIDLESIKQLSVNSWAADYFITTNKFVNLFPSIPGDFSFFLGAKTISDQVSFIQFKVNAYFSNEAPKFDEALASIEVNVDRDLEGNLKEADDIFFTSSKATDKEGNPFSLSVKGARLGSIMEIKTFADYYSVLVKRSLVRAENKGTHTLTITLFQDSEIQRVYTQKINILYYQEIPKLVVEKVESNYTFDYFANLKNTTSSIERKVELPVFNEGYEEPSLTMKFKRNGTIFIYFREPIFVPNFEVEKENSTNGRNMIKLSEVDFERDILKIDLTYFGEFFDSDNFNYTVKVLDWQAKQITAYFNFSEPLSLSQGNKLDKLKLSQPKTSLLSFVRSNEFVLEGTTEVNIRIPKQLPEGMDEEKLEAQAAAAANSINSVFLIHLVIQVILKGIKKGILPLFLWLQLIASTDMYETKHPANTEIILENFRSIVRFEILKPDALINIFYPGLTLQKIINGDFQPGEIEILKKAPSIFAQLQVYLLMLFIILFGIIGLQFLKRVKKYQDKIVNFIEKQKRGILFNNTILSLTFSYVDLARTLVVKLDFVVVTGIATTSDIITDIIMLLYCVGYLVFCYFILWRNKQGLHCIHCKQKYGKLFEMVDMKRISETYYYYPWYMARRLIFIMIPLLIRFSSHWQLMTLIFFHQLYIMKYASVFPRNDSKDTKLELFNEVMFMMLLYCMIGFTDLTVKEEAKFKIGEIYVIFLASLIASNFYILALDVFEAIKLKLQHRREVKQKTLQQKLSIMKTALKHKLSTSFKKHLAEEKAKVEQKNKEDGQEIQTLKENLRMLKLEKQEQARNFKVRQKMRRLAFKQDSKFDRNQQIFGLTVIREETQELQPENEHDDSTLKALDELFSKQVEHEEQDQLMKDLKIQFTQETPTINNRNVLDLWEDELNPQFDANDLENRLRESMQRDYF